MFCHTTLQLNATENKTNILFYPLNYHSTDNKQLNERPSPSTLHVEIHEQQVPSATELHLTVFCPNHSLEGEISTLWWEQSG